MYERTKKIQVETRKVRTSDPGDSNPKKGTACERCRAGREEASSKVSYSCTCRAEMTREAVRMSQAGKEGCGLTGH